MAFDPVAGKLLLCTTDANGTQSWFWEWNGTNWSQRLLAATPPSGGALATDVVHNKVVMFDGSLSPSADHTWTLVNGTSALLGLAVEPSLRFGAGAAFDPVRGRMVLFGGANAPASVPSVPALGDTWEFELGAGPAYTTYGTGCAGA